MTRILPTAMAAVDGSGGSTAGVGGSLKQLVGIVDVDVQRHR